MRPLHQPPGQSPGQLLGRPLRLGVNIDHVATLRNARFGEHPSVVAAARVVCAHGADGITVHLREDRRHIRDDDVEALLAAGVRLNLEMAACEEMVLIAERLRPAAVCFVPERREEQTTEGGLDVTGSGELLRSFVGRVRAAGCEVSLFVEPDEDQILAAGETGAQAVELHTGSYALHPCDGVQVARLGEAARVAERAGLACHAGHGLTFDNVAAVARIRQIEELNIGYFLVCQALFDSLGRGVAKMKRLMHEARNRDGDGDRDREGEGDREGDREGATGVRS